jgi:hypothetical protein
MKVVEAQYRAEHGLLVYVFDTGAWMAYGPGVLPGTDVETYRFVVSRGFKDRAEYKGAQTVARAYSKRLGFSGVQGHFESFQSREVESR